MPISSKIKKFLDDKGVKYDLVEHKKVFTAFDKSQTLKLPEKIIVKTLVMKTDKNICLAAIPANRILDLKAFKKITKSKKVGFVSEKIIKQKLKGIKIGAIPPLGSLWNIKTYFDKSLLKEKKLIMNGGSYNLSIMLSPSQVKKIEPELIIGNFTKAKK